MSEIRAGENNLSSPPPLQTETAPTGSDGVRKISPSPDEGKAGKVYKYTHKSKLTSSKSSKGKLLQKSISGGRKGVYKIPVLGKKVEAYIQREVLDNVFGTPEQLSGDATTNVADTIYITNQQIEGLQEGLNEALEEKSEIEDLISMFSEEPLTRSSESFTKDLYNLSFTITKESIQSGEDPMTADELNQFGKEHSMEELRTELDKHQGKGFKEIFEESPLLKKAAEYLIERSKSLQTNIDYKNKQIEARKESLNNIKGFQQQTEMGVEYDRKVYLSENTEVNIQRLQEELGGVYQDIQVEDKKGAEQTMQTMLFGAEGKPFDFEQKTVLLFTGSGNRAENYAYPMVKRLQKMGCQVMIVNPLGFGDSEGEVSGKNLLRSADAAFAFLTDPEKAEHMDEKNVAVMGFSLGGAMAAHLAAQHPDSRFIGDRTYTSMADVGVAEFQKESIGTDTAIKRKIGKFAGALVKPVLENVMGDLEVEQRLKKHKGKKFIASGTVEAAGPELAKKMKSDKDTTVVTFEGDHIHHDNFLWFNIRDEDAPYEFADFISDFINE